ncbi:LysR family transcriptional regulator [Verminephrobacter aporrectodeae]|uniref:LysR family transcriptional regulator n=1 Tax=Verminephrobacter aporrectodeae TaxID=1110389 RepID=UPI002243FC80|nr:LysR substrate-binding domain-containing protein [Verminephrobacter aporrectodeae]MCW8176732.1 LysR family transcriptional regulator [Verminephrobacter aporrectodeae subsp. tuberculatae]MCW8203748.1 LysR family transcriptional regulator [Verminephrobacter aporrectodeae subsp. tuberculatae]
MTLNIKYRPVKAFLLAAEHGSFTHAASVLGVTQPSFTALIQDLEHQLGLRLFERSTRSMALTAAGREFLARVQRPLADIEEAYRSVLDLSAARRGNVILGALPSTAFALVAPALQALRCVHPALGARVIEAHNDELLLLLRSNQIECALATLPDPGSDLVSQPVIDDVFCAVFARGHALQAARRVLWRDLLAHELILLSRGSSVRAQFDRAMQRRATGSAVLPRYDVTHILTAAAMARRGLGVAILPRLALPELDMDGLSARAIASPGARRSIGMVHRRDRVLSPATQRFFEQLQAVVPAVDALCARLAL